MTRARIRKRFDLGRLRVAAAGPGSDTRTWVTTARVDDDPEAISFEPDVGWVVDVTFIGGDLAEEGPVPCRVAMGFGGEESGILEPPALGCEVIVVVPDGDPNANPIIVGYLDNGDGCGPPETVFGFPVTEQTAQGTTYVASKGNLEAEYQGSARVQGLQGVTIAAPAIALAGAVGLGGPPAPPAPVLGPLGKEPTAEGLAAQVAAEAAVATEFPVLETDEGPLSAPPAESYVRGDQFAADAGSFLDSLGTWVGTVGAMATAGAAASATLVTASVGPLAPLVPGFTALGAAFTPVIASSATAQAAIVTFRATLVPGIMLSEKIRGD